MNREGKKIKTSNRLEHFSNTHLKFLVILLRLFLLQSQKSNHTLAILASFLEVIDSFNTVVVEKFWISFS